MKCNLLDIVVNGRKNCSASYLLSCTWESNAWQYYCTRKGPRCMLISRRFWNSHLFCKRWSRKQVALCPSKQSEHGIVIYPLHRDAPKTQKLEDDRLAIKCLLRKFFFIL